MPKGSFVILLSTESDFKVLGYYFKDKTLKFEITSDLFLRLNLNHSKNKFSLLKLKDTTIESYLYKFKGKLSRKAIGIIIGILLDEEDDPEKFRVPLKNSAATVETIDILEMTTEDFESQLKEIYIDHLETLDDLSDANALKRSIINRTKDMLSGGKKERKIAQELLEKIEDNVHAKISEYYKEAEDALKDFDYEKSSKLYKKAAEVAEELLEKELAQSLIDRAKMSLDIPSLTKKREELIKEARNSIRKEDFNTAFVYYKKASDLSKKLMQPDKEEEYALKSKALQDFFQVDQRFKKKK
ncbi:MAG: hypothetical protein ACFFAH_09450 [Promethearchaeota archaeon]